MSCLLIGVEYGGPKLWVDRGNVTEGFSSIAHHGHAKVGFGRSATQGKKKESQRFGPHELVRFEHISRILSSLHAALEKYYWE